jgi:hypothetical protein
LLYDVAACSSASANGKGSFAFKTAGAMFANCFLPDTISPDVHKLCINGPPFDQMTTTSKFLYLGIPLPDIIDASTLNTAYGLRRPELGSLKPGNVGDATILAVTDGHFDYVDVIRERLVGGRRIVSDDVVVTGRWWPSAHWCMVETVPCLARLSPSVGRCFVLWSPTARLHLLRGGISRITKIAAASMLLTDVGSPTWEIKSWIAGHF